MSLALADGTVGIIHYTLKNDAGEVMESSSGEAPLAYLHGHANVVPGLEKALAGKTTGDKLSVVVPPAEAYGELRGNGPQRVHRREFPKNMELEPGLPFQAEGEDGTPFVLWVTEMKGAWVWVDVNHPMAGKTLHFEVEVIGVREALAVELKHGHAHGVDGLSHHS